MEIKSFKRIEKNQEFYWESEELFVKECFTQEEIDKKNENNLRIIKAISNCLSEYQILSEEQLIEAYKDKYPLPISDQDIEKIIGKILKNFKTPFNENEKNFLKKPLINTLDKEIFVDEKSYYFNLKMSINIPLLIEKPESFIRNSKKINRFVVGIISRKIDPDFSKKCEIEEQGQKIDLRTQLLARYQNNYCSICMSDLIYFSRRLNKLSQKDRNKFLMGLDNWLFPKGNLIEYISYHGKEWRKQQTRRDKKFCMAVFVIFLFVTLVIRIKDFVDGNQRF